MTDVGFRYLVGTPRQIIGMEGELQVLPRQMDFSEALRREGTSGKSRVVGIYQRWVADDPAGQDNLDKDTEESYGALNVLLATKHLKDNLPGSLIAICYGHGVRRVELEGADRLKRVVKFCPEMPVDVYKKRVDLYSESSTESLVASIQPGIGG